MNSNGLIAKSEAINVTQLSKNMNNRAIKQPIKPSFT